MKISPRTILAAALLTALPMGSALACTISAWNGTGTAAAANAGGPGDNIARYSGACGLSVNSNQYVVDNTPNAEGTYRARFYVLTKAVGGATTIFKATTADNGGGTDVIRVDYNGSSFSFYQNGNAAAVGTVPGIVANRWYSIEVFYKAGATFSADVAGAVSFTGGVAPVNAGIGAGTVGSAVLGVSGGTATGIGYDSFESTRSEDTPIGRLCRGDANGDGNINALDRITLNAEIISFGATPALGQPDADENGSISATDRIALNSRILNFDSCP